MPSSYPTTILRQNPVDPGNDITLGTTESRAISTAAMLLDIPMLSIRTSDLALHKSTLNAGALPVGSVEFMREAMRVCEIQEPQSLSYHESLHELLHREAIQTTVGSLNTKRFIKPIATKTFSGFIYDPAMPIGAYDEHDQKQCRALQVLGSDALIWSVETVKFIAEWRYYVQDGVVIGKGRYGPNELNQVSYPSDLWVQQAIELFQSSSDICAWSLDIGRLENGVLALVEANDAWALGLCERALDPAQYLQFLHARWMQIREMASRI